jgi:glutamine synthetase type III
MDAARDAADALEQIIDDNTWPIPKMRELLFTC